MSTLDLLLSWLKQPPMMSVSECQQSQGSDSSGTSSPVIKYTFQDNDQTLVGNGRKVMTSDVVLGSCQYYQSASARGLLARLCTSMIGSNFSQVAYIYIANACYLDFHSLVWSKLMQYLVITSTGKSAWLARKAWLESACRSILS